MQGVIDLVGRSDTGGLVIVDHKSRALKPRSKRKKPTKTNQELDEYLRQLYLYAVPEGEGLHSSQPIVYNLFTISCRY